MTIGLLTSPLPFIAMGAVLGAMLMAAVSLAMASRSTTRTALRMNAVRAAERRETIALRRVIAACDRGASNDAIRRIASDALYPRAIALDDQAPIIPEAQRHG